MAQVQFNNSKRGGPAYICRRYKGEDGKWHSLVFCDVGDVELVDAKTGEPVTLEQDHSKILEIRGGKLEVKVVEDRDWNAPRKAPVSNTTPAEEPKSKKAKKSSEDKESEGGAGPY